MQENLLFEYAVIRVMPKVEREEFINVGVVLYCPKAKFLQMLYKINEAKISALNVETDIDEIKQHLHAFEKIANGAKECGTIARLDMAGRFRWLTAMRSTVLQTSRVHPGLCTDPVEMLASLHQKLVL